MKRWNNARTLNREFCIGDDVILFDSRLKLFTIKLKIEWSGLFVISKVQRFKHTTWVDPKYLMLSCYNLKIKNYEQLLLSHDYN